MTDHASLLAVEARLSQAYANRDIDHLDFLISDDCVYLHQSGAKQDKMAHLEPFRSKEAVSESVSQGPVSVLFADGTIAVTNSSTTLVRPDNRLEIRFYTRVWRMMNDQWLLVSGSCQSQILN